MKVLKWLTFIVLFSVSLSFSTDSYESTYEDSTSESTAGDSITENTFDYQSTVEDLTSESIFDYPSSFGNSAVENSFDYQLFSKDSASESAFESSIRNLLYPPDDRDCPLHEHWEYCTGLCQRNCSNWSKALICPDICVQGCLCDWGFTRGPEGNCIPVSECPPNEDEEPIKINVQYKCRRNEHFSPCGGHEECQKDCSNYDKETACDSTCEPGCVCDEGFVRGRSGKCILIEQCERRVLDQSFDFTFQSKNKLPRFCRSNEHFSDCDGLPLCQKSCSNYKEQIICPQICVPGCVCDVGFVNGPSGECIPLEQCPLEMKSLSTQDKLPRFCRSNEHFSECDGLPLCQKSCSNYKEQIICPRICVPGCVCDEGFVNGPSGECIPLEQCPLEMKSLSTQDKLPKFCRNNEHFSVCDGLPLCQKSCSNYKEHIICPLICVPGCVCDEGYVNGPAGECIPLEQCPLEMKSPSTQESKETKSQIFNSFFEDAYEKSYDTSSTTSEDLYPFTESPFEDTCPDEPSCTRKCRLTGHRYGVCIGVKEDQCVCFE